MYKKLGFTLILFGVLFSQDSRPNIIYILVDDLRYDALGITGHHFIETPNIDRIAEEGVNFSNAFVNNPVCVPSRASILTGLYSHQNQIVSNQSELSDSLETIGMILQEYNYITGMIGKWHVNRGNQVRQGWDKWVSFPQQGDYFNPELNIDGDTVEVEGYMTDILTDHALEFIDQFSMESEPFFLLLSHKAVHSPFLPNGDNVKIYDNEEIHLPQSWHEDLTNKPAFIRCRDITGIVDDFHLEKKILNYVRTLMSVEESTGRIFQMLDSLEITDDTFIVFSSDHGYHHGEHNLTGKQTAYEESIKIPLFCRYPSWFLPGMEVTDQLALIIDIPHTILELAEVNNFGDMKGISLYNLANHLEFRENILIENMHVNQNPLSARCTPDIKGIRGKKYKYVVYPKTDYIQELYDLSSDPIEVTNLFFDSSYYFVIDSMRCQLDSLRQDIGDTLNGIIDIEIPDIEANSGDTVDIPIIIQYPVNRTLNRFSLTLAGFENGLNFIDFSCDTNILQTDWLLDWNDYGQIRLNGSSEEGTTILEGGTLLTAKAIIADVPLSNIFNITIESALFNNGQYPVRKNNGVIEIHSLIGTDSDVIKWQLKIPDVFRIHQNYPNPFNPRTKVRYDLPKESSVTITIYDVMGRKVKVLFSGIKRPGYHTVVWDGTNTMNELVSAGMYIYKIEAGNFLKKSKMVLIK